MKPEHIEDSREQTVLRAVSMPSAQKHSRGQLQGQNVGQLLK